MHTQEDLLAMLRRAESLARFGAWEWDIEPDVVRWSPGLYEVFGLDPSKPAPPFAQQPSLFLPEDFARLEEMVRRCAATGEPYALELAARRPDGAVWRCWARGGAVRDANGVITRLAGFCQDVTELAGLLKERNFSGEDCPSVFRTMHAGFAVHEIICDEAGEPVDYRFLKVNPAFERMTGLRAADIEGRRLREVLPESEWWLAKPYGRVALTGEPAEMEIESKPLGKWFEVTVFSPSKGRFACIISDITARKNADRETSAQLEELRRWQRVLVSSALRRRNLKAEVNDLLARLGEPPRYALGEEDPCPGESTPRQPGERETRLALLDALEEQKRSATALAESEQRLRIVFEAAPDAILVAVAGRVAFANRAAAELFGAENPAALSDADLETLWPEKARHRMRERLRLASQSRGPFPRFDEFILRLDGGVTEASFSVSPISFGGGQGLLLFIRDVSARREMERRLRTARRLEAVATLTAGLARDLDDALAPARIALGLLENRESDAEKLALLRSARDGARKAGSLVRQLMQFAELKPGEKIRLNLRHLAEEMSAIMAAMLPAGFHLSVETSPDLWPVEADPAQIGEALTQLLANARESMPAGGRITIRLRNGGDARPLTCCDASSAPCVLLEIEDTGRGIPPENLDRVFDPFFSTKPPGKGSGLGLATVHRIAAAHGGTVSVSSTPGQGSVFRLCLPAVPPPGAPEFVTTPDHPGLAKPETGDEGSVRGSGEMVLIAEPDASVRAVLAGLLRESGYRVAEAADGATAVSVCAREAAEAAAVITELDLPHLDGRGLAEAVRALRPGIPVLCLARSAPAPRFGGSSRAEFDGFIPKPLRREELLRALSGALARRSRA